MDTVYCEYLVAKYLLDSPLSGIDEGDIMKYVWGELNRAVKVGKMIDVPLKREENGRIPSVVYMLNTWLGRGVLTLDVRSGLIFKVSSRLILQDTMNDYSK